jgi:predicted HTH transcriptional regulator
MILNVVRNWLNKLFQNETLFPPTESLRKHNGIYKTLTKRTAKRKVVQVMSDIKKPNRAVDKEIVFKFIKKSNKGITAHTLANKTGHSQKKIEKVLDNLEKKGKIECFLPGVYTKA